MSFQGPGQPPQGQPDPYGSQRPDEYTSYQQPQAYEQYQSYDQPQGYDQPQAYDQYGQQQYAQDAYAQSSGPPAPQQYPPQQAPSAPPYGQQQWSPPPQGGSGLSTGAIVALFGGGLVVLLVLVLGGVWLATRDSGTPTTGPSAAPPSATPAGDDSKGIQMTDSERAKGLFPDDLEPPEHPKYTREAVGETDCANVAAADESKNTLTEVGCKKVYLALYVSDDDKYAVTMGYIDVGSESAAKDGGAEKYGDYPEYNSWFKYLIPEGSKITEETKVYTYVSSTEQYVIYGTGAYFDGKDAKEGLDDTLMGEAIGVAVAIQFA